MNETEPVTTSSFSKFLWALYFNAPWLLSLLPACLVAAFLAHRLGSKNMETMSYLAGELFTYAALGTALFYSLLMRKRSKAYAVIIFLIFYVVMYTAGQIGMNEQRRQASIAMQSAKEELNKLTDAIQASNNNTDGKLLSSIIQTGPATPSRASGQFGEFEKLLKEFMMAVTTFRNDYLRELHATGWESIMDLKRIRQDKDMLETKRILNDAKAVVTRFEGKTENLFETCRTKIRSLTLEESAKQDILKGFNQSAQNSSNQFAQHWKSEKETMEEIEAMLMLLADKAAWRLQGEELIFQKQETLVQFNQHQKKLQDISKEQEEMQQRQLTKSKAAMDKMSNIFQK